jgi:hypothetical protein
MAVALETGLKTTIVNNAAITALIGTRCYPLILPQAPMLPAITYQRISAPSTRMFGDRAFTTSRYRIVSWDSSLLAASNVGDAVIVLFDDYVGAMNGVNVSGTVLNDLSLYDPETARYAYVVDVELWY